MTIISSVYAIRERDTMKFMPQLLGRGHTYSEPTAGVIPRLFHNEQAAKIALRAWLKGHAEVRRSTDWESGYTEVGDLIYHKVEGRSAEKMKIVRVCLTIP